MKRTTILGVALLALFGVLGGLASFIGGAYAQYSVPCRIEQGGNVIDFASGCTWKVGSVAVTATAAELNILDTVTATAAELNILDGVTATAAELNKLDGNIGADPGATCTAGTIFIDTDETVDTNCTTTADNALCLCVAADTWAAVEP